MNNSNITYIKESLPLWPRTPVVSTTNTFIIAAAAGVVGFIAYNYIRLKNKKSRDPFKELPTLRNTNNWLLGAAPYFYHLNQSDHHSAFSSQSSPSGLVGFWMDFDNRGFTTVNAEHARAVLRHNSTRNTMKSITRHTDKTLGKGSLIMIPGGLMWRSLRNLVAKMFTVDIINGGKNDVADVSRDVIKWLMHAASSHSTNDGKVSLEAEHLFQLYSLEVYGRVSISRDFGCFANPSQELKMTETATSWNYLQDDVTKRALPQNMLNPLTQFYWMPTKHNREYNHHFGAVQDMLTEIIDHELMRLGDQKSERDNANLVTHLITAVLEEQSQPDTCKASSGSSRCPFSGTSKASSNDSKNITPTSLSPAQKQELIDSVSGILRTLTAAGFETTAISLTYVMYFLSLHPRYQELCAEEAERVLGSRSKDFSYNADFSADDLVFCRAIFTETLRLYSPVFFTTRVLEKDMSFNTGNGDESVTFPKGTKAFISPSAISRDERNFERAQEFIPERWVKRDGSKWVDRNYEEERKAADVTTKHSTDSSPESISAANPNNFFAFSDGARNCVGKRLAILEASVMTAMIMRDMKVELTEDNFEVVTKRKFATVGPVSMPIAFRRR